MMEVVDDEEYEKLMSSKKNEEANKEEPIAPASTADVDSNACGKKDEDEGTDNQSGKKQAL
jgi:hypothetical protein